MDNSTTSISVNTTLTDVNATTPRNSAPRSVFIPWNNPNNIMTKEASDDAVFVMECVLLPILSFSGITGNVLSLIVLLHKKLRSSTGVVLVGLAFADLLSLTTNMIRKSTCIIGEIDKDAADKYYALIFGPIFYLKTSFDRISVWLVVLISIERLIAVLFPLKIKIWVSKLRMIIAVVTIYVLTLSSLSPIAAQYTTGTLYNPATQKTRYFVKPSPFYFQNIDFLKIHNEIFGIIVFRYIPVFLVIIFNSIIVFSLQRRMAWRKQKSSSTQKDEKQAKITRMLLIVSLVCLICTTPGALFILYSQINPDFVFMGKYHNFFVVISDVCMLLEQINSSANFVIYMLCNEQFAQVYKKLFCACVDFDRLTGTHQEVSKTMSGVTKKTEDSEVSQSKYEEGKSVDETNANAEPEKQDGESSTKDQKE